MGVATERMMSKVGDAPPPLGRSRSAASEQGPARRIRATRDGTGRYGTEQGFAGRIRALLNKSAPEEQIRARGTNQGPKNRSGPRLTNQGPT